jgi:Na+-transporting methylmalonyl-CoA/oxaloacetate decarboxylase gamma subunit
MSHAQDQNQYQYEPFRAKGSAPKANELLRAILQFILQTILRNGAAFVLRTAQGYSFFKLSKETQGLAALLLIPCLLAIAAIAAALVVLLIAVAFIILVIVGAGLFVFLFLSMLIHLLIILGRWIHRRWRARQARTTGARARPRGTDRVRANNPSNRTTTKQHTRPLNVRGRPKNWRKNKRRSNVQGKSTKKRRVDVPVPPT